MIEIEITSYCELSTCNEMDSVLLTAESTAIALVPGNTVGIGPDYSPRPHSYVEASILRGST